MQVEVDKETGRFRFATADGLPLGAWVGYTGVAHLTVDGHNYFAVSPYYGEEFPSYKVLEWTQMKAGW